MMMANKWRDLSGQKDLVATNCSFVLVCGSVLLASLSSSLIPPKLILCLRKSLTRIIIRNFVKLYNNVNIYFKIEHQNVWPVTILKECPPLCVFLNIQVNHYGTQATAWLSLGEGESG